MAAEETSVKITGDSTGAVDAMKRASDAVSKGFGEMQGAMKNVGSAVSGLSTVFGGFSTLIAGAGVTAINKMVQAFATSVEETRDLARALGITTNEVAGLQAALDDIGASTGEYETASKGLQRQLNNNEKDLKAMGLATRDAKGELRPLTDLMADSIAVVNSYKEGTDRNIAAQQIFGKGIAGSSRLLMLNKETLDANKIAADELGLSIGGNAVEAWKEYDSATDRAGLSLKGIGKAVGETVMPAVTVLINAFNTVAPAAIMVLRGALSGLTTAFLGLVNGVKVVWEVINAMVISVAEPIMALGRALAAVVSGDFKQAGKELTSIPSNIGKAWDTAYANILASSSDTADKIKRLWGASLGDAGGVGDSGGVKGTKTATMKGDKDKKAEKEQSVLPEVEERLAAKKLAFAMENDLREMNKAQELATYQELLSQYNLSQKDQLSSTKKSSEMKLGILREQRQTELALSESSVEAYKAQQLAVLDAVRAENQFKVDMGKMTADEMIAQEEQLEKERYEIVRNAVEQRLEILSKDPTKNVVALQKLNEELAAVEQEHATKSRALIMASQLEQRKDWQGLFDSIGAAFGNVVTGLVNRTMTLGQAVKSLFAGLLQSVASYLGQMVAKKVAAYAAEKAMQMGSVAGNAAVAGSGAAAAVAPTPFAGPALALAALAAVFAAVIGMQSSIPSARNGFDIPSGLNPLTQLHEREMVLPQEQADQVRNMTNGGGSEKITIALTGGDFIHKDQLATLLKKMNRSFEFK